MFILPPNWHRAKVPRCLTMSPVFPSLLYCHLPRLLLQTKIAIAIFTPINEWQLAKSMPWSSVPQNLGSEAEPSFNVMCSSQGILIATCRKYGYSHRWQAVASKFAEPQISSSNSSSPYS